MGISRLIIVFSSALLTTVASEIDSSLMDSVFSKVNDELRWMTDVNEQHIVGHSRMAPSQE